MRSRETGNARMLLVILLFQFVSLLWEVTLELIGNKWADIKQVSPICVLGKPQISVRHLPFSVNAILSPSVVSILFIGLVSAIAALDGKQYNELRSKLHSLSYKVNPKPTVSGFKVFVRVC